MSNNSDVPRNYYIVPEWNTLVEKSKLFLEKPYSTNAKHSRELALVILSFDIELCKVKST